MIGALKSWVRKHWRGTSADSALWLGGAGPVNQNQSGYYANQSTLAFGVGKIAEDAAGIPWKAYRPGTDEEVEDHPVLQLWRDPNLPMTGYQFWTGTYVSYLLFGEFVWWYPDLVMRQSLSRQLQRTGGIALLDPRAVRHQWRNAQELDWFFQPSATGQVFQASGTQDMDPAEFTRGYRYNPDSIRGLSKIQSVILELSGDLSAAAWNEAFFSNQNGIPSGVLTPGKGTFLDDNAKKDLRRTWNQRHGETRTLAILPGEGWTYEQLGLSQTDMGWPDLRMLSQERILQALGIPPFIAGVQDAASYNNSAAQKDVYWGGTITGFLRDIGSALNDDFLKKIGVADIEVRPDWSVVAAMTENLAEKSETASKLFMIGFTRNAVNERLDLGFDLTGDPNADTSYLPMGLVDAEADRVFSPSPAVSSTPDGDSEEEPPPRGYKALPEGRREIVWRQAMHGTESLESQFSATMVTYFNDLERAVLDRLPSPAEVEVLSLAGRVVKIEERWWIEEEANRILVERTRPQHLRAMVQGAAQLLASLTTSVEFDLTDPRAIALLGTLSHKITGINDRLEADLRAILLELFDVSNPASMQDVREAFVHQFDISRARADTIGRTETGFAWNGGRQVAMQEADIQFQEWLTSRDPDVRDTHQAVDGEIRSLGASFSNGILFPNDPNGPAGEVINCRCVAVPVEPVQGEL